MAYTYEKISSTTLGSNASSFTFTSIPSGYTDLILDVYGTIASSEGAARVRVGNGSIDTSNNYSRAHSYGSGGSTSGYDRINNTGFGIMGRFNTTGGNGQTHFMSYSNTSMFKTWLSMGGNAAISQLSVNTWRSTGVINTIEIYPEGAQNWVTGTTFTLYGITRH